MDFTMKKYIFVLALFLNVAAEQNISSQLQQLEQSVLDNLEQTHLDPSKLPNIEEGDELLRERCLKNGNNETIEAAMAARLDLQKCIKDLIDFETIQKEIEDAKPNGDLDTVFKKYCRKSPILKACVSNYTTAIEPCLAESEKSTKDTGVNITESLINFICFKEGDRIAIFIAEGGPECLMNKMDAIQVCLNGTFGKYMPQGDEPENATLREITLDEEQCRNMDQLKKCVVKELERCIEPTPANIVESMFKFVWKSTPCIKYSPQSLGLESTSKTSSFTLSFVVLSVSLILSSSLLS